MNYQELSIQAKNVHKGIKIESMSQCSIEMMLIEQVFVLFRSTDYEIKKNTSRLAILALAVHNSKNLPIVVGVCEIDDDFVKAYSEMFNYMCATIVGAIVNSFSTQEAVYEVLFNCNQIAKSYDFDLEIEILKELNNISKIQ